LEKISRAKVPEACGGLQSSGINVGHPQVDNKSTFWKLTWHFTKCLNAICYPRSTLVALLSWWRCPAVTLTGLEGLVW